MCGKPTRGAADKEIIALTGNVGAAAIAERRQAAAPSNPV
jgi:hypothetical protein